MTRRVKELHQAVPAAYCELHPDDARDMGVTADGKVKVSSRRGSIVLRVAVNERGAVPRGTVFVPFFDETLPINDLTLDAFCPISKEPDYKKCAVKVEPA